VARIQSRGAVNRVLVKLETEAPVAAGAEVALDGLAIGQVTSSAPLPSGRGLALAYLKVEQARAGQRVAVGGVGAAVAAGSDSRR
jgi:folate-binding Fe-S cluster repair protein YgfZ